VTSLVAAAGIGILLGITTQLLQGILPGAVNWIANAMSGWLLAAYLVGSRMPTPRVAAAASVAMLIAAVAGYYATVEVRFGYGTNAPILLFWGFGSVAGGLVFGAAGWWWRRGGPRSRAAAVGLLAALFVAEGAYFLLILPDATVGLCAIAVGLIVPTVFGRNRRERAWGYVALMPGLALGVVGYGVTLIVYGVLTGA
jgi:hypothetical protein